MKGITVLSIAYPFAPVREDTAGGAEQVLRYMDEALVEAGAVSTVIACRGSKVRGNLVETGRPGKIDDSARSRAYREIKAAVDYCLDAYPVDLVHMHGLDFDNYLPDGPAAAVPVLATLHLPITFYNPAVFDLGRPNVHLQCVSYSQLRLCPPEFAEIPVIENGVDVNRFSTGISRRCFALSLGRVCPEKGFHLALDAARLAGMPLFIGGEVFGYEAHETYYRESIAPRLDGSRYRFLGPLGLARKRRLLSAARCLLAPSLAAETSSLVAMEALACGTPVIAFPAGALPEIVEHGKTGFIVEDVRGMAEAMKHADRIDPDECRRAAAGRFSANRMASGYFGLYKKIIERSSGYKHACATLPGQARQIR